MKPQPSESNHDFLAQDTTATNSSKSKEYRAAIICSIIASLLCVYFLDPILGLIARIAISVISFLSQSILDRIYTQVSHLHSHDFSFLLFMMYGLGPFFVLSLGTALRQLWQPSRPASSLRFVLRRRSTIAAKLAPTGIGLVLAAFILLLIGSNWYQLKVISDFEHHLRILAPHLTEQEEEELVSQWSQMVSEHDYNAITARLKKIANNHSITLPSNSIYSPTAL